MTVVRSRANRDNYSARPAARSITQANRLVTFWSDFTTVTYNFEAGLGNLAELPVRLLTESPTSATKWDTSALTSARKFTGVHTGGTANNKNLVPTGWDIQVESIATSTATSSASTQGGITVGFFNRGAVLAVAGVTTDVVGYPEFTSISWNDINFQTPRVTIGGARVYKLTQPPWANGWTLEECHALGHAFVIRWSSSSAVSCSVGIRFSYQRGAL